MTLRHALASLERRGLVVRRVGRDGGTFVAEPRIELSGLAGLSDQLRAQGRAAGAQVISAVERDATAAEAELGDRVYELVRVRLADGEAVALERGVYSAEAFPGLLDEPLDGSLSDDEPILCEIFVELFAEHGKPLSAQEYFDHLAGHSDPEIVYRWLGRDHPDVDAVIEERVRRYRAAVSDGSSIGPAAREAV